MSTQWFSSDAQQTREGDWHRVIVDAATSEAINAALANLPHHFRIGLREVTDAAIWGPSRRTDGRWKVEIAGVAYRSFPASELENWLRTFTGDFSLQVRIGYVTGIEQIQFAGRGFTVSTVGAASTVVQAVGGAAQGAASLVSGVGDTASTAGALLPFITPLLILGALILAIIAVFTAPKWLPVLLSG